MGLKAPFFIRKILKIQKIKILLIQPEKQKSKLK